MEIKKLGNLIIPHPKGGNEQEELFFQPHAEGIHRGAGVIRLYDIYHLKG